MMRLIVANLNYSSWSMRAWLAIEHAGAAYQTLDVGMFASEGWKDRILQFSGAGRVPVLVDGRLTVHESLAIAEYVAERHPQARLWPEDLALRARARALSCEMHAGFAALREAMPTNLRGRARTTPSGPEVDAEIARAHDIFEASMATTSGDFLLGDFSVADCMFYPLVTRFRTYGVPLPAATRRYSEALYAHPAVQKLEALASGTPPVAHYDAMLG